LENGEGLAAEVYSSNYVTTGRYTLLTAIPLNMWEQFHRTANIWFLIISIFQLLPLDIHQISKWETIAPL
jgi:hypothetical protein